MWFSLFLLSILIACGAANAKNDVISANLHSTDEEPFCEAHCHGDWHSQLLPFAFLLEHATTVLDEDGATVAATNATSGDEITLGVANHTAEGRKKLLESYWEVTRRESALTKKAFKAELEQWARQQSQSVQTLFANYSTAYDADSAERLNQFFASLKNDEIAAKRFEKIMSIKSDENLTSAAECEAVKAVFAGLSRDECLQLSRATFSPDPSTPFLTANVSEEARQEFFEISRSISLTSAQKAEKMNAWLKRQSAEVTRIYWIAKETEKIFNQLFLQQILSSLNAEETKLFQKVTEIRENGNLTVTIQCEKIQKLTAKLSEDLRAKMELPPAGACQLAADEKPRPLSAVVGEEEQD